MTYRLFYSPGSCSLAVHIALEEVGAPFSLDCVPVATGATQTPEYLAINPKGRVPALAIEGEARVLTELPAILGYLAHTHPDAGLIPADPLGEARCHEWLAWLAGWVHGIGYGEIWRAHRFVADASLYSAINANGRKVVEEGYDVIERKLAADGPYACGRQYSIVDPMLVVLYRWGNRIGIDMASRCPAWAALAQHVVARPAAARAMRQENVTLTT